MDWWSHKVLAWRLSNTMDVQFCLDALDDTLDCYDILNIFNIDQGSQFTSWACMQRRKEAGMRILMDGRGWFLDNIFIERLWYSPKYECIHLNAFSGGRAPGNRRVDELLQSSAPSCRPWQRDTGRCISGKAASLRPGLAPGPPPGSHGRVTNGI